MRLATGMLAFMCLVSTQISCTTFEPKVAKKQPYLSDNCQLVTRKLYLNKHYVKGSDRLLKEACRADLNICVIALLGSGVWTTSTLVISGSITASGNILHWMKYQGRCELSDIHHELLEL